MQRQSDAQRELLREATTRYREALPGSQVEKYLAGRGLTAPSIQEKLGPFRFGVVSNPVPGHERFAGMLAIPYLRRSYKNDWAVVSMKFRCIQDHDHKAAGHGKYDQPHGQVPRLYNTNALIDNDYEVGITEGEVDAVVASVLGVPSVGIPGANNWKAHWAISFQGYQRVFVFADGDKAGRGFAKKMQELLPNAVPIHMPDGYDVNDYAVKHGRNSILNKVNDAR